MRTRAALLLAAFAVFSHAGVLFGQGFQGGVRGSIKDAGGVVPGVEVTLTNEKTNISRTTTTNESGEVILFACWTIAAIAPSDRSRCRVDFQ